MSRHRKRRYPIPRAAVGGPACSHRLSDWTWVPTRARWEGLCRLCGWTHVASPEMAASIERDVAAYDSRP